jgi:DNA-binding winged helix-turn-helix (wHTH) protein/tetratricopeptide (TPR) repeat protein
MSAPKEIRFNGWVLRTDSGELDRAGKVTRLQQQPLRLLVALLDRPGEVVFREQLIAELWPDGVVDYETGLNTIVRKLRAALGDDAAGPRYIETIPRRGYRFIGRIDSAVAGREADSMAVLSFRPLVPDSASRALALGMADALITRLSRIPGLRVSSLSAVRSFDAADRDPVAAGRALRVDAVLEGSLQVDSQCLRVSSRLLRVADGRALWSDDFDEPMMSLFEVQDAVARKVVAALAVQLSPEQARHMTRPATMSMAAYQHYVSGLYLWQRRAPEAAVHFEAALREDPQYASAWAGLAGALAAQAVYGHAPPGSVFPRAKQAALRAVELDPDSALARSALAHLLVQYERRYRDAEQEYLCALRLDPSDANTWMRLALVRVTLGRLDDALVDMTRARSLEPMNLSYSTNLGFLLYLMRDYAAAERELERVLDLDPSFDPARAILGRVLLARGDTEGAIREFQKQRRRVPGGDGDLGRAYSRAGRCNEARAELGRLELRGREGYGVAYESAGILAALGETRAACEALRRALNDHSQLLGQMGSDPAMDPLHGEACFIEIERRLLIGGPAA